MRAQPDQIFLPRVQVRLYCVVVDALELGREAPLEVGLGPPAQFPRKHRDCAGRGQHDAILDHCRGGADDCDVVRDQEVGRVGRRIEGLRGSIGVMCVEKNTSRCDNRRENAWFGWVRNPCSGKVGGWRLGPPASNLRRRPLPI